MWKIGNVEIKNSVVLAPMAGVSNIAFMKICEEMNVAYVITELISSEGIVRSNKKTLNMLKGLDQLTIPYAVQLFGSDPDVMADAARIINDNYPKAIIDLNFGCPVPKVAIKSHAGSALLKEPEKIRKIVEMVVSKSKTPVTVKIRSGWDQDSINAVTVAKICEEAGASAIAVHARTRSQGYGGKADWNIIKEVKTAVNIPVIGNGDIKSAFDSKKMIEETGCDAIMIGRGVLGNPWLIRDSVNYLENNILPQEVTAEEKLQMLKKHYKLLLSVMSEKQAILEIRIHALWYIKGLPNNAEIKNKICQTKNSEELFLIVDNYLKSI